MPSTWPPRRGPRRRSWLTSPGSLRYLATLAAVANLVLAAAILLKLRDLVMKNHLAVAAVAAASLLLSGCITSQVVKDLTPEAKEALALKFLDRCGGTVNIGAGGGTGQLGGGFQANFQLTGTCPIPDAPPAVPLRDLGKANP